jgi:hypothetical protein
MQNAAMSTHDNFSNLTLFKYQLAEIELDISLVLPPHHLQTKNRKPISRTYPFPSHKFAKYEKGPSLITSHKYNSVARTGTDTLIKFLPRQVKDMRNAATAITNAADARKFERAGDGDGKDQERALAKRAASMQPL